MALSGAERNRRYREKQKTAGLGDILKENDRKLPSLDELIIFSDGSASQFKQRFLFKNLSYLAKKFDVILSWHFFATSHGK
ncbi:unnamed protein product, partial [Rotaria magnacalcarata]